MEPEALVQAAKDAIDRVMEDMRVPATATRASLRDIRDHISVCLDALESDAQPDEE